MGHDKSPDKRVIPCRGGVMKWVLVEADAGYIGFLLRKRQTDNLDGGVVVGFGGAEGMAKGWRHIQG